MGDAVYDVHQLSKETFRLSTYDANALTNVKGPLAKAGFFYTREANKVRCFVCSFELDAGEIDPNVDVLSLHKEKRPECRFAMRLEPGVTLSARPKKFLSYDSLRYEKERLETFIEWPILWLSPEDLAADGFYYLRTNDHCACVFCRGIVGAWEVGDTPRGEHQRHFPHCPFIRGQPVGNVPLKHSTILDMLPLDGEECPMPPPRCEYTIDEAGNNTGATAVATSTATSGRHMPGSYPESKVPSKKENVNFSEMGLRQYTGPKRKDYVTKESREKSFSRWPERVLQRPNEMADAGFFYCGLSDHVRCFHCGSGLRNWENDDDPWVEHARWYPDCSYVLGTKGQDFIDTVRRENPPYLRSVASKDMKPRKVSASSGQFKPINDKDLDPLMESDIIQGVKSMGFPLPTIRKALKKKIEQTGMPFFSLEPCIEAILQIMEEETRNTIHNNTDVEEESRTKQSDRLQELRHGSQTYPHAASASSSSATASGSASNTAVSQTISSSAASSTSNAANNNVIGTSSAPSENSENASATTVIQQANAQAEAMEVEEESTEAMETQAGEGSSSTSSVPGTVIDMREADERINAANEVLKPPESGSPSAAEAEPKDSEASKEGDAMHPLVGVAKASNPLRPQSSESLVEEMEKIRESRTCKICMDADISVVFLPCTHMSTCSSCAVTMAQCPICRGDIKYTIKPIFS